MGGIGFLLVIILYIVGSAALVAKVPTLKYKIVALLAVLLIPTADAVYGRIKLQQMCKAEGGLRVYQVAHNVEGFMADSADGFYFKYGYQFTEAESSGNKYYRATQENGQLIIEDNVVPKSKYRLRLVPIVKKENYSYAKYLIEAIDSKEILSTDTQIGFNGGWAERLLAAFSDGGISPTWCAYTVWMNPVSILNASLKK